MPTVEGVTADHHKYVVEELIDAEVVERQSRVQEQKLSESSVVHYHKHDEPCGNHEHGFYGHVASIGLLRPKVN